MEYFFQYSSLFYPLNLLNQCYWLAAPFLSQAHPTRTRYGMYAPVLSQQISCCHTSNRGVTACVSAWSLLPERVFVGRGYCFDKRRLEDHLDWKRKRHSLHRRILQMML